MTERVYVLQAIFTLLRKFPFGKGHYHYSEYAFLYDSGDRV